MPRLLLVLLCGSSDVVLWSTTVAAVAQRGKLMRKKVAEIARKGVVGGVDHVCHG